ncbi:hypothetical protein GALMADRAFT_146843 [Galerina marginata CBS 339.88]|uniref:Uncharacterized protein n=1 Tax=Galerina marginata (strain CBS 339.88) TaxID=685588 RepID=A0A067SM21_GALM3|nr:hypothetical protein GALMADRAFT_146843 [Galerina marginata CBS 339.88]
MLILTRNHHHPSSSCLAVPSTLQEIPVSRHPFPLPPGSAIDLQPSHASSTPRCLAVAHAAPCSSPPLKVDTVYGSKRAAVVLLAAWEGEHQQCSAGVAGRCGCRVGAAARTCAVARARPTMHPLLRGLRVGAGQPKQHTHHFTAQPSLFMTTTTGWGLRGWCRRTGEHQPPALPPSCAGARARAAPSERRRGEEERRRTALFVSSFEPPFDEVIATPPSPPISTVAKAPCPSVP